MSKSTMSQLVSSHFELIISILNLFKIVRRFGICEMDFLGDLVFSPEVRAGSTSANDEPLGCLAQGMTYTSDT